MQPIVGDRSIFGLEHERHRRERKLLMPPFHRDHIPAYGQLIVTLTHQAIDTLAADIPFQAKILTQDIALEVILRVVFGLSAGPRFTQLKALIVQLTDIFLTAGFALALFQPQFQKNWNRDWRTFLQIKQQMSHLIYLEIRDRRQHQTLETSLDILSLLLQAQDEKGEAMSDQELHDELITLLLAGHETTATAHGHCIGFTAIAEFEKTFWPNSIKPARILRRSHSCPTSQPSVTKPYEFIPSQS